MAMAASDGGHSLATHRHMRSFSEHRGDTGAYGMMRLWLGQKGCQGNFGYTKEEIDAIERSLSSERLSTYLRRTNGDRLAALRLYEHNTRVSEALFGVIRGLEVALRNSMHDVLRTAFNADDWYDKLPFALLKEEKRSIRMAKLNIRKRRKPIIPGRVVAELTFGFWCGLTTKVYDAKLWVPHLHKAFPHRRLGRREANARLNDLRVLRNRIAHHECVVHTDIHGEHSRIIETLGWICPISAAWVQQYSSMETAVQKSTAHNP